MGKAKDILLEPIQSKIANEFMKCTHYSGKVVQNSQLHIGVFYEGILHGALQFGPSLDKRKIQGLVQGTEWHEFMELNRLAFDDVLPRNSESRALGIAMKILRQHAPQLKWVISFADATQCGDGTIYRASGFVLTGIKDNTGLMLLPHDTQGLPDYLVASVNYFAQCHGDVFHFMSLSSGKERPSKAQTALRESIVRYSNNGSIQKALRLIGCSVLQGFQLRYIYFLDPTYRSRLTVPEIPYSQIWEMGAGMYKGEKVEQQRAGVV